MLRCVDDDWTPPYHPELQHIEELWRDVKQYVARKYVGLRSMTDLRKHVLEGFLEYARSQSKIDHAITQEVRDRQECVFSKVLDLTE